MGRRRYRRGALPFAVPARHCLRLIRANLGLALLLAVAAFPAGCARMPEDDPRPSAQNPTLAPETPSRASFARMPSFAPVVERVLPAVVNVSAIEAPRAPVGKGKREEENEDDTGAGAGTGASPLEELLRRLIERQRGSPSDLQRTSVGSGFIIDAAGYIVTSDHVVENAGKITVMSQDNREQEAKIVGRDALTDLALLKIAADHPLPHVSWGDSDAARVGDWVLAVGSPFGLGGTVAAGILSARGRDIHAGPYDDFLQIDAAINRGDSGGPTFNLDGQVIGISTAIATSGGGSIGIAFAIPSNLAKPVIEQLRARGKVTRGWLGLQLQEVTPALARSFGLPKEEGVVVADMTERGPGEKAGFRQGDVVLSFNGHRIQQLRDLPRLVAESPIGQKGTATVWRNGRETTLSPVIEEMPENLSSATRNPNTQRGRDPGE